MLIYISTLLQSHLQNLLSFLLSFNSVIVTLSNFSNLSMFQASKEKDPILKLDFEAVDILISEMLAFLYSRDVYNSFHNLLV